MKKNLVSIIILALLIVNLVLTCFMMFSFTGAAQKTWTVVSDIAYAMNMAKGGAPASEGAEEMEEVAIQDLVSYDIADPMTIPLKAAPPGPDGETIPISYIVIQVSLQLNSEDKDFKDFGEGDLTQYASIIQDEILNVFGKYTKTEVQSDELDTMDKIKKEIVEQVRVRFNSDFVYSISFRDIKYS